MRNILELSGPFISLGGLVKFLSSWGTGKMVDCGLLGGISTQAETTPCLTKMEFFSFSKIKIKPSEQCSS